MATNPTTTIAIDASAASVFETIVDPRTYPDWLLGAQRIRRVDAAWPEVGSAFHHTIGIGPARLSDHTTVVQVHAPKRLVLRAQVGPMGSAIVTFTVVERDGRTVVELHEEPSDGPLRLLWSTVGRRLLAFGIWGRNEASLERLKTYVEDSGMRPDDNLRTSETAEPAH